ncbi:MAG: hypothetical protein AAFX87_21185, partial [Bacteroidota bacterium]
DFYFSPQILPEQSNMLVHELLHFLDEHAKNNHYKAIKLMVDRLVLFFSAAYRNNAMITTISD